MEDSIKDRPSHIPYDMHNSQNIRLLKKLLHGNYNKCMMATDQCVFYVDKNILFDTVCVIRTSNSLPLISLMDITAIDYGEDKEVRFDVIYIFLCISKSFYFHIKVPIEDNTSLQSIHTIYSGAVWYQREIHDMYGIWFHKSKDMRRLLNDYDFHHHPLRKNYPLSGYTQIHYNSQEKKVTYKDLELVEDYRDFDFESPWKG